MALDNLIRYRSPKFVMFGGKGGVGKTSMSATTSIAIAEQGFKTLIVSTDPAHSISDVFDQRFPKGEITRVEGVNGELYALEIDPAVANDELKELLKKTEEGENEFGDTFQALGLEDLGTDLFETTPPGMDEAVALVKVMKIIKEESFDKVVFDTAPTGHTLRLLSFPEFLDTFVGKLLKLRIRISNTFAAFKSLLGMQAEKDRTLELLEKFKKEIIILRDLLQDHERTQFTIVTIPTLMAVYESERLYKSLKEFHIAVEHLILNQIMPENPSCPFCTARYKSQRQNFDYIKTVFKDLEIFPVPYFPEEIRGIEQLKKLIPYLRGEKTIEL